MWLLHAAFRRVLAAALVNRRRTINTTERAMFRTPPPIAATDAVDTPKELASQATRKQTG